MSLEIVPLPVIPRGVREAALFNELVLFIGAGASQVAGCPGWAEFADGALKQLVLKGRLTDEEFKQIGKLNPRVKLSIATAIEDGDTTIDYRILLHPKPLSEHAEGRRLYRSLFALGN